MDFNQGPSGYEPVPQDKLEYTKMRDNINILRGYEFFGFSAFMRFYAILFYSVRNPLEKFFYFTFSCGHKRPARSSHC
jgi:hypothetical protein